MGTLTRIAGLLTGMAVAASGGLASADPVNNAANGRAFCILVAGNPTPSGVVAAMRQMTSVVGPDAAADGALFGVRQICPEYSRVYMQAYGPSG